MKDIESYFKFLPFKIEPPFSTAVIHIQKRKPNKEIIDLHEQLIQMSRLFKKWELPSIFAVVGEEIVLLNEQFNDKQAFMKKFNKILQEIAKQNINYHYVLGMSGAFTEFKDFERSIKEARVAQRFPNKKLMTDYEDLGMLGDIVTNMSLEQLHEMAKKTLKDLYHFHDPRKRELLHTLYVYLLNGQRLKETMEELTLSIGGIQYRIKQIEELLQVTVKNASTTAYILLVIQALILSGELQFD
jgi:DNA-binding PucR family transcriptional regulator